MKMHQRGFLTVALASTVIVGAIPAEAAQSATNDSLAAMEPTQVFLAFNDPAPSNPADPCRTGTKLKENEVGQHDDLTVCTFDESGNPSATDTSEARLQWVLTVSTGQTQQPTVRFNPAPPPTETTGSGASATAGIDAVEEGDNLITVKLLDINGTELDSASVEKQVLAAKVLPEVGKFVIATLVSGTVSIKTTDIGSFEQLSAEERQIPVGSLVDTRKGRVRITHALRDGEQQSSDFYDGLFEVSQDESGLTTATLTGGSFAKCSGGDGMRRPGLLRRRTLRLLSADDTSGATTRGRFRTRGRHSAATVRGTIWTVADRCDGTLTTVKRGKVVVRDFRRKRNVTLKAGESYLAQAKG